MVQIQNKSFEKRLIVIQVLIFTLKKGLKYCENVQDFKERAGRLKAARNLIERGKRGKYYGAISYENSELKLFWKYFHGCEAQSIR